VLAATVGTSADEVSGALLPVIRDLIGRGFLEPPAPERPASEPPASEPPAPGRGGDFR